MENDERSCSAKREARLIRAIQIGVTLGILSYDTIVSTIPWLYYGARMAFLACVVIFFLTVRYRISLDRNVVFVVLLLLYSYHTIQSFGLDFLVPTYSDNLEGFMKVLVPRFLFFVIMSLMVGSIARQSLWVIANPIVYLGTLFAIQGIIAVVIVYFDLPVPRISSVTSYSEMREIGHYGILGYGNSIYGNILRAQSIFAECNVLARFLGFSMWITFYTYLKDGRRKYLIFLLIQGVCLVLTYALSAFIAMAFTITVWWMISGKRSTIVLKGVTAAAAVVGVLYLLFVTVPEFVSSHEVSGGVGAVMSRYSVENIGVERPMADSATTLEYLLNKPFGKGFSLFTSLAEDRLGTGNFVYTWIRLGGIFSILVWILLLLYLAFWYLANIWLPNVKDLFVQCAAMATLFCVVSSASTGAFLETYFLFWLAVVGTLWQQPPQAEPLPA